MSLRDQITQFAVDTRHRPHQYATAQQNAAIARKMIAAHVRAVPWQAVQSYVSPGDMKRIVERIKPADLSMRAPLPAEFYGDLVTSAQYNGDSDGIYESFVESVYPSLGAHYEDTSDMKLCRQKAVALYLAQATGADTRQVVHQLYPNSEDSDERERVYDAIIAYGPLKHERDTEEAVARELGTFIQNLSFPDIDAERVYIVEPVQQQRTEEDTKEVKTTKKPTSSSGIKWAKHVETTSENEQNEGVDQWKAKHALSALFPFEKAAKQLVIMYHAPELGSKHIADECLRWATTRP